MPFNKLDLIAQEYPELVPVYEDFLKLKELNEEKLEIVQHYLKHSDEQSLRRLHRLFKRIIGLMEDEKKDEAVEKRYVLILLHQLKTKKDKKVHHEIKQLIRSLEELSKLLSLQFHLIRSDRAKLALRSNFQEFIRLVLEEQKIINGDLQFLDDVDEHFKQQIDQEMKENARKVQNIGHRGARGLYAENTLGSMRVALQHGVQMIEFDVQICKSGEIIVMHDYAIDRTTNGHGLVKELTWAYLDTLKMKGTNEKVPTLEGVIRLLKGRCSMNIEIKAHDASREEIINLARGVAELIRRYHVSDFLVSSFNHDMLRVMRGVAHDFPIGALFEDMGASQWIGFKHLLKRKFYQGWGSTLSKPVNMGFVRKTLALGAVAVHPPMDMVNKDLIALAHQNELKVNVWTVNNSYYMMQLIFWGVDGIITDRPDILLKVKNSITRGNMPKFENLIETG